jgi:hypothetical protein
MNYDFFIKEALIKYLHRHAGEYQHPVNICFDWILACARMTIQRFLKLIQRFHNTLNIKIQEI